MKPKRTKLPPPEFFRYQKFLSDATGIPKVKCCKCGKKMGNGIHDLKLDLIYCFGCADEDGVKGKEGKCETI